jgi:hypothetical protein
VIYVVNTPLVQLGVCFHVQAVCLIHVVEKPVHGSILRRRMLPEELRARGCAIGTVRSVHNVWGIDATVWYKFWRRCNRKGGAVE